jgi:hypothetical protein
MLAEAPMEDVWPVLGISVIQLQQSIALYWWVTYQQVINILNSFQQPNLANLFVKMLLAWDVRSVQSIIWLTGKDADWYFWPITLSHLKEAATRPAK